MVDRKTGQFTRILFAALILFSAGPVAPTFAQDCSSSLEVYTRLQESYQREIEWGRTGVIPTSSFTYQNAVRREPEMRRCIELLSGAAPAAVPVPDTAGLPDAPRAAEEAAAEEARMAAARAAEAERAAAERAEAMGVAAREARETDVDLYREVPLFLPPGTPSGLSLVPDASPDKLVVSPTAADRGDGRFVPGPICVNITGVCTQLEPGQEIPANAEIRLAPGFPVDLVANGHPITVTGRTENAVVRQQDVIGEATPYARLLSSLGAPLEVPAPPPTKSIAVEQGALDFARVKTEGALINLALEAKGGVARVAEYADDAGSALQSVTRLWEGTKALFRGDKVGLDVGTLVLGDGCGEAGCSGSARAVFGSFWRTDPRGTGYTVTVEREGEVERVIVAVARGSVTLIDDTSGEQIEVFAGQAKMLESGPAGPLAASPSGGASGSSVLQGGPFAGTWRGGFTGRTQEAATACNTYRGTGILWLEQDGAGPVSGAWEWTGEIVGCRGENPAPTRGYETLRGTIPAGNSVTFQLGNAQLIVRLEAGGRATTSRIDYSGRGRIYQWDFALTRE